MKNERWVEGRKKEIREERKDEREGGKEKGRKTHKYQYFKKIKF